MGSGTATAAAWAWATETGSATDSETGLGTGTGSGMSWRTRWGVGGVGGGSWGGWAAAGWLALGDGAQGLGDAGRQRQLGRESGGGGGTTTGPSDGGAMNGVVPLASTESPTVAEPAVMPAMIGSDDMVASMTTITVYRLVGPARPAARCTPATRRPATCVPPTAGGGRAVAPGCPRTAARPKLLIAAEVLTQGGPSGHGAPPLQSVSMCQLSAQSINLTRATMIRYAVLIDKRENGVAAPTRQAGSDAAGCEVAL